MTRKIGIAGDIYAEAAQAYFIARRGDVRKVDFAPAQFRQFFHRHLRGGVDGGADTERDEGFLEKGDRTSSFAVS